VPIVFGFSGDPVEAGLISSLARPGGRLTGIAMQSLELVGKRLEILKELMPRPARVGTRGRSCDATNWHDAPTRTTGTALLNPPMPQGLGDAVGVAGVRCKTRPACGRWRQEADVNGGYAASCTFAH
jgi:hypothetical protein